MRRKIKSKTISIGMAILWIFTISIIVGTKDVHASSIQTQPPANIFAASCSTCHGAKGLGGVTFVKDDFISSREAPRLVGRTTGFNTLTADNIKNKVRQGSQNGAMPAFGPEEITATELTQLIAMLQDSENDNGLIVGSTPLAGLPTAPAAPGSLVTLDILDADPWFWKRGATSAGNRIALTGAQALKVVNTGRTWHTFTNGRLTSPYSKKDSGFIGYAGNYKNNPGDLGEIGYYYADQTTGLAPGCQNYYCKMHPYMQVEVCTTGNTPAGPTAAGLGGTWAEGAPYTMPGAWAGLTRAHKHPIGPPTTAGVGEVWVTVQSQEEATEIDANGNSTPDTRDVVDNSVATMDGTYQVIDASNFSATPAYIANVGNNPHNSWAGNGSGGSSVVLSASWHDNSVSLIDANAKKVLMERRSGSTNAHVMTTPPHTPVNSIDSSERFYISHMGGRAIQEIDVEQLRLGNDPNSNVTGGMIRGATGPHGLWMCDDGRHVLTADTFGGSATLYDIITKKRATASSGGRAPLAPSIFGTKNHLGLGGTSCSRGFTNNALTYDVSVYNITTGTTDTITNVAGAGWAAVDSGGTSLKTVALVDGAISSGNIRLRNTVNDQVAGGTFQARWANLPIQTPVSPAGSGHGRYMVTANKASFNVSITALDGAGNPTALYTIPAGLGAHGVTYGPKSSCVGAGPCYYAYVTNTFEDYISVYDLEAIPGAGGAGSALLSERVYVEGGAVAAVAALDPNVAGLCDVADYTGGVLVYDLSTGAGTDPAGDGNVTGVLNCGVGAMNTAALGYTSDGDPIPAGVVLYVANLPIGVLCPDCRSGVHVGDIPLTLTAGQGALGGSSTAGGWCDAGALATPDCPSLGNTGSTSKYTYLKEEVWVDTDSVACALAANDCSVATTGSYGGDTTVGTINTVVTLDLELGINTGGQGIMGRNTTNGRAAVAPWQP